jgi:hypothetical protein
MNAAFMQFETGGNGACGACAIVITVAIIRGTLYADVGIFPSRVYSDGTGKPG